MKSPSQFICELGTYHQETKVTYCRWLGQKGLHISFGAMLTSRRSQQHGGPTRLICGKHGLKDPLDLVGRHGGHHRAQHGWSSSGLAPCLGWSFVKSAGTVSHITHHTAVTMTEACTEPCSSGSFPLEEGRKACLWIHGVSLQHPAL